MLRPHHVLCAIGWQGRGYSPEFTENMNAIVWGRLRRNPLTEVIFTGTADSICAPCPWRRGLGCEAAERITGLDARHAAALGIRPGQRMNWAEARGRAASRVRPADLQRICNGCQWIALCQPALARLQPTARERCETSI